MLRVDEGDDRSSDESTYFETDLARWRPACQSATADQTLGGGSGGAELKSVGESVAEIKDAGSDGTARASWCESAGMASGAGAHTVARAQPAGDMGSAAETLWAGLLPCSGIWQSSCAGLATRPRQAMVPITGWS
jgi:hypothetical protein